MKKLILLLFPFLMLAQNPTNFPYGIKNTAATTDNTPAYFVTSQTDGVHKKTPAALIENTTNKSDSYTVSSSTTYASTKALVDGLDTTIHKTGDETKTGQLSLEESLNLTDIVPPATLPTVAINGTSGLLTGEYVYGVSYYTSDGKDTGVPNITSVLTLSSGKVDISDIPISPSPLVVGRRIYRTDPSLGDYRAMRLVVQIADNTTTTYQDNIPDASLTSYPQWYNTTGGEILLNNNRIFSITGQSFSIGVSASPLNTGYANHVVGNYAGANLTYGYRNTLNGLYAGYALTTGFENTATGIHSLNYNTTGHSNSTYGYVALSSNTTGSDNSIFGASSFSANITGSRNIGLGNGAGSNETGSDKFYVNNKRYSTLADDIARSILYGNMNENTSLQNLRINGKVGIGGAPHSYYDLYVQGSSGAGLATEWATTGGTSYRHANIYMPFGGSFSFHNGASVENTSSYDSSGVWTFNKNIILNNNPTTSAGTYDFLTRNTSTGVIEKINTDIALTGTPTAPTAPTGTNTTQIATTAFVQNAVSGVANSGTYTPVLTPNNTTIVAGTTYASYTKNGNIVHVTVSFQVTPTINQVPTITVTLPFNRANTANINAGGASIWDSSTSSVIGGQFYVNNTSSGVLRYRTGAGINIQDISLNFTYDISR